MKKVAISACLTGKLCKYNGDNNLDINLLSLLKKDYELIGFCPEDYAFGTPRPTMDLIQEDGSIKAISNNNGDNLTSEIELYAKYFFTKYQNIELFIGKDRSPSCEVNTAKLYDKDKQLISTSAKGIMAKEAEKRSIKSIDASECQNKGVL